MSIALISIFSFLTILVCVEFYKQVKGQSQPQYPYNNRVAKDFVHLPSKKAVKLIGECSDT